LNESLRERKQSASDWFRMNVHDQPETATVLVVEDDFLVRTCAAETLSAAGFQVLEAADAPEAMALLERSPADVVFTDVNMPGEFDGLGLAERVARRWPGVAIVITSGRGCPDALVAGARFVPKPYMPDALPRLLDEVLGRQGSEAKLGCLAG
jgi:two-component system, response regulator PdtaR